MFTLGDTLSQIAAKVERWNRRRHDWHLWNSLDLHLSPRCYVRMQVDVTAEEREQIKKVSVKAALFVLVPICSIWAQVPWCRRTAWKRACFPVLQQKQWAPCNAWPLHPSWVAGSGGGSAMHDVLMVLPQHCPQQVAAHQLVSHRGEAGGVRHTWQLIWKAAQDCWRRHGGLSTEPQRTASHLDCFSVQQRSLWEKLRF